MKSDQFFYEHPVFRHEEFAAWKASVGDIKPASVNTALRYYAKTGQIKPIRRKLYARPLTYNRDEIIAFSH